VTAAASSSAYGREAALSRLLAAGTPEGPIAELLEQKHRAHALVVSRESPLYGFLLLDGMFATTLALNADLPGSEVVLEAGLAPLTDETSPFPRLRFRSRGLRAVVYTHEGVWYLTATGSAAMSKSGSNNEFASVLCDLLEVLSPHLLAAASISRLLRSNRVAAQVQGAIEERVDTVKLGDVVIDLRSEMSGIIWAAYAAMATTERNLIVQRLALGRINTWRRGEWFYGKSAIPPGYRLDDDSRLVVDAGQRTLVESVIGVLANEELSPSVAAFELGRLGLKTRQRGTPERNFAESRDPSSSVPNLRRWVDLWATGRHEVTMVVPFANLDSFGGQRVIRSEHSPYGHVVLPYEPGLPPNGWASAELLALAASLRDGTPPRSALTGQKRGRSAARKQRILTGMKVSEAGSTNLRIRHRTTRSIEIVACGDGAVEATDV
jgi:hypothetical protein